MIILREVVDSDLATFHEHVNDPEAMQMAAFTPKNTPDPDAFHARWEMIRGNPTGIVRTVEFGGEVVGHIASFDMEGDQELTYWIGREYWGKGLASLALLAFLELETTRPLVGRAAFDNVGSQRVLLKCGFVKVGEDQFFANARQAEIQEFIYRLE